ncbi:tail fiber assembly protein [Pseudomonas sp. ES3]|uniref:tail fiber assembly protein n=1 Tax=Pseudomonas sp. ES3 TaxID=3424776 RepID=UPI003D34D1BC
MSIGWAVKNDLSGKRSFDSEHNELLDDEHFVDINDGPEPEIVPLPPSNEELAALAKEKRNQLLSIAANRMGPLQDAVDIARATDDEVARLLLWKGYRIDLNRIEQQEGFPLDIDWPISPDAEALQEAAQ